MSDATLKRIRSHLECATINMHYAALELKIGALTIKNSTISDAYAKHLLEMIGCLDEFVAKVQEDFARERALQTGQRGNDANKHPGI
jgi:hypothetical protein